VSPKWIRAEESGAKIFFPSHLLELHPLVRELDGVHLPIFTLSTFFLSSIKAVETHPEG
jgi:hypothetical protein